VSFRLRAHTCLVAGLACLQIADLICTYLLLDGGNRADVYEANPLARSILETTGWLGVIAFKLAFTGVAVTACLALTRRRPAVALRVLTVLCVMMLGVNAYSGTLLASPDVNAIAEREANEDAKFLEQKANARREYAQRRNVICDAVLAGECDLSEASARLSETIHECEPGLHMPAAARLPDTSNHGEVLAYLSFHVRLRAEYRGQHDRLAGIDSLLPEPPEPANRLVPRWLIQATPKECTVNSEQ
jgi:hypothetical protein